MSGFVEIKPAVGSPDQQHVRWPTERFYWAVLDGSALPRNLSSRRRREQWGYLFENVLPGVAIEEMQIAYVPIEGGNQQIIACGVPVATLQEAIAADSGQPALTLTPVDLPGFVKDRANASVDPELLNLLTGNLEPVVVRQSRRRSVVWATAMISLISAALTVGLQRRIGYARDQLDSIQQQETETYRRALGSIPASSTQPPHLRLVAELRQLQQTRQPSGGRPERPINTVRDLEMLVSTWPTDVFMQTESVVITDQSIAIRGRVPTMADVQVLADALATDGWTLQQPQSNQVNDRATNGGASAVELSLRLDRQAPESAKAGAGAGGS